MVIEAAAQTLTKCLIFICCNTYLKLSVKSCCLLRECLVIFQYLNDVLQSWQTYVCTSKKDLGKNTMRLNKIKIIFKMRLMIWLNFLVLIFFFQIQAIKMMVRWLLGMKNNHSKSGTSTLRLLTTILHSDGDLTEQGKIRYVTDGNFFMSVMMEWGREF